MAVITVLQAAAYAEAAGFKGTPLVDILAIAMAESGLDTTAKSKPNTDGSIDRGILQINSHWHAEVSDACAYNPACAFGQGFKISGGGSNFSPWSTWTNGRAAAAISTIQAALKGQTLGGNPTSPTPVPAQPGGP